MRRKPSALTISIAFGSLLGGLGCIACSSISANESSELPAEVEGGLSSSGSSGPSGSSGSSGTSESPADTTPRVRYVGRTDRSNAAGPRLAWPGTQIIVRFKGPALKVKIKETAIDDGPSGYDIFVDGKVTQEPFVPNDGEGTYDIASGLAADTPHVVELHRRTEAMVGITQILGFEFPNGGQLLAPPAWPDRRIEFLGDSESTGYGVECADRYESFTGATENARKAFPALAATALAAEGHNVSFSGKGIFRNEDSNQEFFEDIYVRSIPLASGAGTWDFGTWKPNVVWINLGANDWELGGSGDRPPPDPDEFKTKYAALVSLVRNKNPDAQIVCAVQGMVSDDYPPGFDSYSNLKTILKAVVDERHTAKDAKVHFHELPRAVESVDLTGCSSHPGAAYHTKAAANIATKVRAITGWK